MERIIERLRDHSSPTSGRWREAAETRRANRDWLRQSRRIAIDLHEKMRECGWSKQELAERMGYSMEYVCKLLQGTEKMTPDTLSKIENTLNLKIML